MDYRDAQELKNAITHGRIDYVRQAIESGADINYLEPDGTSLLILSAYCEQWEVFDYLFDQGAPAHKQSSQKHFVLAALAEHGQQKRLNKLIQKRGRASLNFQDDTNHSAILCAIKNKHYSIAHDLLNYQANLNLADDDGDTALRVTIENVTSHPAESYSFFQRLVEQPGIQLDTIGYQGNTALMGAVQVNHCQMVKKLLRRGANPNILDHAGDSPLLHAVINQNKDITDALINHGANINHCNTTGGETVLHRLIQTKNQEWLDYLCLKPGINLDALDKNQLTPLAYAARNNLHQMAQSLLMAGANPDLPILKKLTAIDFAKINSNPDIVEMIRSVQKNKNYYSSSLGKHFQDALKRKIKARKNIKNSIKLKRRR